MTTLSFHHRYVPGRDPRTRPLLLLHGTGGDENDLLPLGARVAPGAALLSPRGRVLENGMPRFFRRLAEGIFDEADVVRRAGELAAFVGEARAAYDLAAPIAVGFSNGANIAAALLLLHPEALAGAVLLRAMPPLSDPPPADLGGRRVLLLTGRHDPIAGPEVAERLARDLLAAKAALEHEVVPAGHGLSQADLTRVAAWLQVAGPMAA